MRRIPVGFIHSHTFLFDLFSCSFTRMIMIFRTCRKNEGQRHEKKGRKVIPSLTDFSYRDQSTRYIGRVLSTSQPQASSLSFHIQQSSATSSKAGAVSKRRRSPSALLYGTPGSWCTNLPNARSQKSA